MFLKLHDWINDEFDWEKVLSIPNGTHLVKLDTEKFKMHMPSINSDVNNILKQNKDNNYWGLVSVNPHAIELLEQKIQTICIGIILYGSKSQEILKLDEFKFDHLWIMQNSNAISLFKQNQIKIPINWVFGNTNAALEQKYDTIYCWTLSSNPDMFTYDYKKILCTNAYIKEAVCAYMHQPKFVAEYLQSSKDADITNEEAYLDWFNERS